MRVDWRVSSGSCQIFAFTEWNVFSFWILVAFGKTKINNVNVIFSTLCTSNQKVIWFNISMDDSLFMDFLDTLNLEIEL